MYARDYLQDNLIDLDQFRLDEALGIHSYGEPFEHDGRTVVEVVDHRCQRIGLLPVNVVRDEPA